MGKSEEGSFDAESEEARGIGGRIGTDESNLASLMGHFYRGEMDRVTSWRRRLDETTYWAVTIMAAVLTWVFSSPTNPHYILLIGMFAIVAFLFIETRRYRIYDAWQARIRLLQEDLFADALDPDAGVEHRDWRRELSKDLRDPALKTSFFEAFSRRLRRVYLPLIALILGAWIFRITAFEPRKTVFETAGIAGIIPGAIVIAVVGLVFALALAIAFWPADRQSKGEFHDRNRYGEWKRNR